MGTVVKDKRKIILDAFKFTRTISDDFTGKVVFVFNQGGIVDVVKEEKVKL